MSRSTSLLLWLACLLVIAAAAPAQAQAPPPPSEGILLHGWALPESAVITSTTHLRRNAKLHFFPAYDGPAAGADTLQTLEIYTLRTDSLRTTIVEVDEHGPSRVEQHVVISDILEDVHEKGRIVDRGRRPTPLSGTLFDASRAADGSWHRRFLLPEEPTAEQREALEQPFSMATPQYPTRPLAIGDTWEVDREGLELLYGTLVAEATQRMTFQLDSTATYLGRPAAFLSYGLDVTVDRGEGVTMRTNEVGVIIRVLDQFVDVLSQWQGRYRTRSPGAFDDGQPYIAVMEGDVRGQSQQLLLIPRRPSE